METNFIEVPYLWQCVLETNACIRLSKKKHLWLDIGIMLSHPGFESAASGIAVHYPEAVQLRVHPFLKQAHFWNYHKKWNFSILALIVAKYYAKKR